MLVYKIFYLTYQVILPFGLQRDVDLHLKAYLSHNAISSGSFLDKHLQKPSSAGRIAAEEVPIEHQKPFTQNNGVMERILRQRSLQLRDKQQEWQV